MSVIELQFPAHGEIIPSDHGYALFGALSRIMPSLHAAECPIRIGPIRGNYVGQGALNLDHRFSALRLRLPADQIALALPLAGQALDLAGYRVRLGVPQVRGLIPAVNLLARMVVIKSASPRVGATNVRSKSLAKRCLDPAAFLEAAQRKLAALDIKARAAIPLTLEGPHAGQPRRRVMRIHGRTIVGFPLLIEGLSAEESIRLQEAGLGGRQKMGCGFFVPVRERGEA